MMEQRRRRRRREIFSSLISSYTTSIFLLFIIWSSQQQQTTATPLSIGDTVQGTVNASSALYFDLALPATVSDDTIVVTLTPMSVNADPDMFMSYTVAHPDAQHYDYIGYRQGEDAVSIPHVEWNAHVGGVLHIAVKGYGVLASAFSLTANLNELSTLSNGFPMSGRVHRGVVQYYQLTIDSLVGVDTIAVACIPSIGTPYMYVSTHQQPVVSDPSTYDWAVYYAPMPQVYINRGEPHFPTTSPVTVHVAIVGGYGSPDSNYTMYAATNLVNIELVDGLAFPDMIKLAEAEYYKFAVVHDNCDLAITVTPMTGGDPSLYVSRTDSHPSPTSNDYAGVHEGSEHVQITQAQRGYYYFSVYANTTATYTILAQTQCAGGHQWTELTDGVPVAQVLDSGRYEYYRLHVGTLTKDLTITATLQYGDPDLYVSRVTSWPPAENEWPTVQHSDWRANAWGEDLITIHKSDARACSNCYYIIGVVAFGDTAFSLVASTGMISLQENVPVMENLREHEWEYFQLPVYRTGVAVTITVTELGEGDPDVFVAHDYIPTRERSDWHGQRVGGDVLTIPPRSALACTDAQINAHNCTYFVGLYSYRGNSTFRIVVNLDSAVALQDGVPQYGHTDPGQIRFYTMRALCPENSEVTFTLTSTGYNDFYIGTSDVYPEPGKVGTYWWSRNWWDTSKVIRVAHDDVHRCTDPRTCSYKLAVVGTGNSTFHVTARTMCNSYMLINGQAQSVHVSGGGFAYFYFQVENDHSDVSFVLTPVTGDPDLYASCPRNAGAHCHGYQTPNITYHDKSSRNYGGVADTIDWEDMPRGIYYAGVHGYGGENTGSIVALATSANSNPANNVVTLYPGAPQGGVVHMSKWTYYRFHLYGAGHRTLTFTLSTFYGDPDIFINYNKQSLPSLGQHDFASNSYSFDQIELTGEQVKEGVYLIGIYGASSAGFTLSVDTDQVEISLQDGVPVPGAVAYHQYSYYSILMDSFDKDLVITLTPSDGDPDLFVALKYPRPNQTSHEWSAQQYQDDVITVPHTDTKFCKTLDPPCVYHIAVYGFTASTYSLVASFQGYNTLTDGQPMADSVGSRHWRYYLFAVSPDATDLTIALTPFVGNAAMYVRRTAEPTVNEYDYYHSPYDSSNLIIRSTDGAWCTDSDTNHCVYYLGVYGWSNCNYSISATSNQVSLLLRDGVPVPDWLDQGLLDYFYFRVTRPNTDLFIAVTAMTGDPDLYVSGDPQCSRPGPVDSVERPHCTYSNMIIRTHLGGDVVVIRNASMSHPYYIGVHAFRNSTFTIVAHARVPNSGEMSRLINGVPQRDMVALHEYVYYRIELPNLYSRLTLQLTLSVGDPDLVANFDVNPADPAPIRPTIGSARWKAMNLGPDTIDIRPAGKGLYIIGVYGFSESIFTLLAHYDNNVPITLSSGVPIQRSLQAREYDHYVFRVDDPSKELKITVTPFSGDPDIFVADYAYPNQSFHQWSAQNYLEDVLTIPHSTLHRGNYYISIYAYGWNTSYSLLLNLADTVELEDGVPMSGSLKSADSDYYVLRVARPEHIQFELVPVQGAAYFFISKTDQQPKPFEYGTYQWASASPHSTQTLRLEAGVHDFDVTTETYQILVYAVQGCNYTLSASTGRTRLKNNILQKTYAPANDYALFYYVMDDYADITVTVTPLTGDPDLYVAYGYQPTKDHFWKSSRRYGGDTITLKHTEAGFKLEPLLISVLAYGSQNSSFQIMASAIPHQSNETLTLVDGVPQYLHVDSADEHPRLTFSVSSGHTRTTIRLTGIASGDPDLCVRWDGQLPSDGFCMAASASSGSEMVTISGCDRCQFDILVVMRAIPSSFTILANTDDVTAQLRLGVAVQETLSAGHYAYYSFTVDEPNKLLTVTVTKLTGDPDLYVSRRYTHPNATHYDERSWAFGTDVWKKQFAPVGTYYIGVLAYAQDTQFSVLAQLGTDMSLLTPGHIQTDGVEQGDTNMYYFETEASGAPSDIRITLTPLDSGTCALYVTNNGSIPTSTLWQWSTRQSGAFQNVLTIPAAQACTQQHCVYYMAVVGETSTQYAVSWCTGDTCRSQLSLDWPVGGRVQQGITQYYTFNADETVSGGLRFMMNIYSGDGHLVVTRGNVNYPPVVNGNLDTVTIPPTVTPGPFDVGVVGDTQMTYSLVVSKTGASSTLLVDGRGQEMAATIAYQYFTFNMGSPASDIKVSLAYLGTKQQVYFKLYISDDVTNQQPTEAHHTWGGDVHPEDPPFTVPVPANKAGKPFFLGVSCRGAVFSIGDTFLITAATANSFTILQDGVPVYDSVNAVTQAAYYSLPYAVTNNFTLVLEPCTGDVGVYTTFDQLKGKPGPNNYRRKSVEPGVIHRLTEQFDTTNNQAVNVFVAVQGLFADVNMKPPSYKLHTHIATVEDPHVQLADARLIASSPDVGVVQLEFTRATQPAQVEYHVYYADAAKKAVMYTECGLNSYLVVYSGKVVDNGGGGKQIVATISSLTAGATYDFNILALARMPDNTEEIALYSFATTRVSGEGSHSGGGGGGGLPWVYILGVGIPCILILVVAIVYLACRNRQLTKELDIEMHDVPKAAVRKAVRGPPGATGQDHSAPNKKATKNYSQLLGDDDDDDEDGVGTVYDPPEL